jgi:hypothetical protein
MQTPSSAEAAGLSRSSDYTADRDSSDQVSSWLLKLPGDQEQRFYEDASVQRYEQMVDIRL